MTQVRLILGDQLNASHSWFQSPDDDVLFVMAELPQETAYVVHHRQKVLAFFAAMRRFASALERAGHRVRYFTLDDSAAYAASGQYINKMSHYCKTCAYDVKAKTGEGSCPFNSFYWHFLSRHRDRLGDNPRMKLVYANWDRQAPAQRQDVLATAEAYLARLNTL